MTKPYKTCGAIKANDEPCGRPSGWGTDHVGVGFCKLHDANKVMEARVNEAKAIVAKFGGRVDMHPAQALLELVQHKAAEVEYWRAKATNDEANLVTYNPIEGKAYKAFHLQMLHEAEDQLAKFSQACVRVGVEEVRVRAMALQGEAIVAAMKIMLSDPRLGVLTTAPIDDVVRDTLKRVAEESSPSVAIGRWKA